MMQAIIGTVLVALGMLGQYLNIDLSTVVAVLGLWLVIAAVT